MMGVPVVTCLPSSPGKTPDMIFTASGSCRCVVKRDCPGRRRSSSRWMSSTARGMRGGQPSTTQPIAAPWLSPKLVKRNIWPKVLNDMATRAPARVRSPRLGRGQIELFGPALKRLADRLHTLSRHRAAFLVVHELGYRAVATDVAFVPHVPGAVIEH